MRLRDYIFDVAPRAISYERARKGLGKPANPLTITFSVTAACRSLCKTCNIGRVYLENPAIAKNDLTLKEIEATFKTLGPIYFFNVSGGEPFMRMDLAEILRLAFIYLKPKLISIPTNSLAPKAIEKTTLKILEYMDQYLPPHVPLSIKPSIDGVGEMHDFVRGIKGNFVKLEETIDRLLAIREKNPRLHVDLGSVISNYNLNHLDVLEKWVHERGIESYRHEIAEQRVEFHNVGDPITPSPQIYRQLTREFSNQIIKNIQGKALHTRVTESVRLAYYDVANQILKEKRQVTPCYGGLANIHLDYNGEVWPCCILGGEQSMGNIRDWNYDMQALLASPKAKDVIGYIAGGNCACPLASQWLNNVLLTPKHMLNVMYILLYRFPFRKLSPTLGKPKVQKDEAIVLTKAGTIPDPTSYDTDDLIKNDKEYTEAEPISSKTPFHVLGIRNLSDKSYILRIERHGLGFIPGQYFILGKKGGETAREYTIYSSLQDDFLEFMITEVADGNVSPLLRNCGIGEELHVEGPLGYFEPEDSPDFKGRHIFIASGAGIAPFHSFVKSIPKLDYQILHGVRRLEDCFDRDDYDPSCYTICTSREEKGDYFGRVTAYLKEHPVDPTDIFYICGNTEMLYEVYDLLISQGVTRESIKVEVFY
jgi:ferredoxin-NADP reductase/MoaA/NifB/PqqE/SkfB family radical SAM enzyme